MKKLLKILLTLFISLTIMFGFALPLNPVGNWYQQFMPYLNNKPISDITFLDSLTGYAVTPYTANDTAYIIKTTNKGDSWNVIYKQPTNSIGGFTRIIFLNQNTGYAGGNFLFKTINAGVNWFQVNIPFGNLIYDMSVLNQDTIWFVDSEGAVGGVFRTTNGGASWQQQLNIGSQNPQKIYMANARTGFISTNANFELRRTTNSGVNWTVVNGENGFTDMKFVDSLTGWKAIGSVKKTTNGGLNWVQQTLPAGGIIFSGASKLSVINLDTIWAVGGYVQYPNLESRGILYRTTNGGQNWLFQVPDTGIHLTYYSFIQFIDSKIGWAYRIVTGGIHTTLGGDPIWLTGITQISNEVPKDFRLYQNYPNPFNPSTNIKYQIVNNRSKVNLVVYDITGKEVSVLVNAEQSAGTYKVDFSGNKLSSGVYFYKLIVDGRVIDTKKMIELK